MKKSRYNKKYPIQANFPELVGKTLSRVDVNRDLVEFDATDGSKYQNALVSYL